MLFSATEIIKKSWNVSINCRKKIWVYLLLLFLPTLAMSVLGTLSLYLSVYYPSSDWLSSLIILLVFAASLVFALWVSIGLAKTLANCVAGMESQDWRSTLSSSNHLIWPVIYTSFLVSLIVLGGAILLIIPGIIFSVWYSFTFYTVIFENKKWTSALSASKSMVVGRWWAIFWRLIAPGFIFGLLAGLASFLLVLLVKQFNLPPLAFTLTSRILNSVVNVMVTPVTAAATLILYLNARQNPTAASSSEQPLQ